VPHVDTVSIGSMLVYVVIGILAGLAGSFMSLALFKLEELFERSNVHWMWWPGKFIDIPQQEFEITYSF
jgi:H+/Cl- antiporter ClcA